MNVQNMQAKVFKATQEWASAFEHLPWDKYWRGMPRFIEIVMIVLLGKAAAELTWLIFAPSENGPMTPATAIAPSKPAAPQPRLMTVASLHLFGIPMQNLSPGEIDAQETGLKLTLRGVFSSSVPQHSMAIIADQSQQEKVYGHGDAVVPGVVLYEVYADKVILERSGSFETLSMPREGKDKPPVIAPVGAASSYAPPPGPAANAGDRLKALRSDLVNQPQKFWDQVRIDPYMVGGELKGFRFNHRDPQLLQSLGITPSDVIVDVNGSPATDPSILQSMMSLENQEVVLGVLRNGQRIELRISL